MKEQISKIPEGNYTGYYWMNNQSTPVLVDGGFPSQELEHGIPFIVEANIYDSFQNSSINIRHNGKEHIITKFDLDDLTGFEQNVVELIGHRIPGKGKIQFIELWKEESDELCAGFTVLKPYARVFVGFKNQNK